MADNLTVSSPGAGAAPSLDVGPRKKETVDPGADRLAELKQLAQKKLGRALSDTQLDNIIKRREARKAHEEHVKTTQTAFEAEQGKESLGSKAADAQTRAAKSTGAQDVKSAKDGLTAQERQSIASDPDAGPRLPPALAKPATPEQAKKLVTQMLEVFQLKGEPIDIAAYAKTLSKLPPSQAKDAGAGSRPGAQGGPAAKGAQAQPGAPGHRAGPGAQASSAGPGRAPAGPGAQGSSAGPGRAPAGPGGPAGARAGSGGAMPGQPAMQRSGAGPGSMPEQARNPLGSVVLKPGAGAAGTPVRQGLSQTSSTLQSGSPARAQAPAGPRAGTPGAPSPQAGQTPGPMGQTANRATGAPAQPAALGATGPDATAAGARAAQNAASSGLGRSSAALTGQPGQGAAAASTGRTAANPTPAASSTSMAAMSTRTGRTASSMSGAPSTNAGGGLFSDWDFGDGMNFNWDAFFSAFLIRSQEDMAAWKQAMRKLRQLSLQAELASHELAITLAEVRNTFKYIKAGMDLTVAVAKIPEAVEEMIDSAKADVAGGADPSKLPETREKINDAIRRSGKPELEGRTYLTESELTHVPAETREELRRLYWEYEQQGGPGAMAGLIESEQRRLRREGNGTAADALQPDLDGARQRLTQAMLELGGDEERWTRFLQNRNRQSGLTTSADLDRQEVTSRITRLEGELATAQAGDARDAKQAELDRARQDLARLDTEEATLLGLREIDRQVRYLRPQSQDNDDRMLQQVRNLDENIEFAERQGNGMEVARLTRERDAMASLLPARVAERYAEQSRQELAAYPTEPPADRTPEHHAADRAVLEERVRRADDLVARSRMGSPIDTPTYRRTLEQLGLPEGQAPTEAQIQGAGDDLERSQRELDAYRSANAAHPPADYGPRLVALQNQVDGARARMQVLSNERVLRTPLAQDAPPSDRAAHHRAFMRSPDYVPSPPPLREGETPEQLLGNYQAAVRDLESTRASLPEDPEDWTPEQNGLYNQKSSEVRLGADRLAAYRPQDARTELAAAQDRLTAFDRTHDRDKLDDDERVERNRLQQDYDRLSRGLAERTAVTPPSGSDAADVRRADYDRDLADLRASGAAGDRTHAGYSDLEPSKLEEYLKKSSGIIDTAGRLVDGVNETYAASVDKAVGAALGFARKNGKAANGQMRSAAAKMQGMINQLIQVMGMGRAR